MRTWRGGALGLLLAATLFPLQVAQAGTEDEGSGKASLQLAETTHDFGVVEQNREYHADIAYRNAGLATIHKLRVKADCSCYAATVSTPELAPGARGTLSVRFRTLTFNGPVHKKLRLIYEDGTAHLATLTLTMKVFGGVVVSPGRMHFGDVLTGTRPQGAVQVMWYEGAGQPFEILGVDVEGEAIETRVEPHAVPEHPKWKGWLVHFRFTQPPPDGVYSKRAVIRTTLPGSARVVVPLTAHVVGKVWVQTHRIHLGLIPQGESRTAGVTFRPFDATIQLGKVSARSRKGLLQVRIEKTLGPRGPTRRLQVTVPASAPPGPIDDIVELHSEVPGEEITEIGVRGRVFVRQGGK